MIIIIITITIIIIRYITYGYLLSCMLSKLVSLVCSASFWTNMDFSVSSWFLSAKTRSESSRAESRSADSLSFSSSSFCCKTHHTERRWLFTKKRARQMIIWIMSSRLIKESWTSIFQAVSWNSQLSELLVWQVIFLTRTKIKIWPITDTQKSQMNQSDFVVIAWGQRKAREKSVATKVYLNTNRNFVKTESRLTLSTKRFF